MRGYYNGQSAMPDQYENDPLARLEARAAEARANAARARARIRWSHDAVHRTARTIAETRKELARLRAWLSTVNGHDPRHSAGG